MHNLVLSCFPGMDLLGLAFQAEGFCVVRGPDPIFGSLHDIRTFHPPAGRFDGLISGPPCQAFSRLAHIVRAKGQTPKPNLIPEFERVVAEARPTWFIMENVAAAPEPAVPGYITRSVLLNNRAVAVDGSLYGPEQNRERRFSFGTPDGLVLDLSPELALLENPAHERAVVATSSKEGALAKSQQELRDGSSRRLLRSASALPGQTPRRAIERCLELQGLPPDCLDGTPFTVAGKYLMVGNGVPIPTGRAIARAVRRALQEQTA